MRKGKFDVSGVMVTTIESPEDGGWYAEVFDRNGKEISTTEVFLTEKEAKATATATAQKYKALRIVYDRLVWKEE